MKKLLPFRLAIAVSLLLAAPSCAGPGASPLESTSTLHEAITNGTIATEDAAVVGIVVREKIGCSGVLIDPRVVLTAAHCLVGILPDAVLVGGSAEDGTYVSVLRKWIHPDYKAGSADHDLGMVLLREPVNVVAPPLNQEPVVEADVGRMMRIVGFGLTSSDDALEPMKRQGTSSIGSLSPLTFSLEPSPSQPCSGDSGGPALWSVDGQQVVAGIVSQGDVACTRYSTAVRVDVHLADFVQPLIAQATATSGATGESCIVPGNCASAFCFSPADAPSFSYCSMDCASDVSCAPEMRCATDGSMRRICQYAGPSPGAIGAPCEEDGYCQFGMCARFTDGSPKTCSALCFSGDAEPCPHGGVCTPIAGREGVSGCAFDRADDAPLGLSGGCSVAWQPRSSPYSLHALLLVLAVWALHSGHRVHRGSRSKEAPLPSPCGRRTSPSGIPPR